MYCILDWALHHTGLDSPSLSRLSVSDWLSLSNDHLPGLGPLRLSIWRTGGRLLLDNVSIYPGAGQLERLQSTHTLSLSLSLSLSHSRRINSPAWLEAASLTASWRWRCVRGRGTTGWEVWRHQVSMYWGETLEPALPVPRLVESGHTDIRSYTNIDTTTTTTTTPASQTPTTTTTTTTKSQDTTSKYRQLLVSLWTAQSHYQYKWP